MQPALRSALSVAGLTISIVMTLTLWMFLRFLGGVPLLLYYLAIGNAFLNHRHARHEQLRLTLANAAAQQLPLWGAVRALQREIEGDGPWRRIWQFVLLNFVSIGYPLVWHRHRCFEAKLERLADRLETGMPLAQALAAERGLATPETILNAAVGESSGTLGRTLDRSAGSALGLAVVDETPRLFYPLLVLFWTIGVVSFQILFIVPKLEKIAIDFRTGLPPITLQVMSVMKVVLFTPWYALAMLGLFAVGVAVCVSPSWRWWFPGTRWFYRTHVQGRILRMLGVMLDAGQTVPAALRTLIATPALGEGPRRRLALALAKAEQGEPLAPALAAQGLMPGPMVALYGSAERAGNLPWALEEMGDALGRRATTRFRRGMQLFAPLTLVLLGLLVAAVSLAMFLPVVHILTNLTP